VVYLFSIVIDIMFGIWGSLGKPWYWYFINIILLFAAGGIFSTSYIQLVTRTYAIIALKPPRALSQVFVLTVLNLFFWVLSYIIGRIALSYNYQLGLFFLVCILVSTVVAIKDDMFQFAINTTIALTKMSKAADQDSEK